MRRILFALAVSLLVLPGLSFAETDKSGKVAIGYWSPEAPLGVRYQMSQKAGLDLGIGFAQDAIGDDPTTVAAGDEKKNLQLNLEAGVPLTLIQRDHVNFFFRPGILFQFIPTYNRPTVADPYDKKSETDVAISAILGAEWFATDDLSLSVGEGIQYVSTKGVFANELTTGDQDSSTLINGLQALDITRIGFHFYF